MALHFRTQRWGFYKEQPEGVWFFVYSTLPLKFFEYLKMRVFEYLNDDESFILKYSHPQILKNSVI